MRRIWTAIFLICIAVSAQAQEQWNLQQCVDYALENNLQIQLNQLNIQTSEEALKLAEYARYPNLNGFATHNYNWGRSFDVFTNTPITERVRSNNFGVNGNVTLFSWSQLKNTIKQRNLDLKAANLNNEKQKNDIVLLLANAYLQILFNQENLENAQLQVASLQQQIERTNELVQAGVLAENNLLDLQSQQATNELQVVNSSNALAISTLQLRQILQLPSEQPFSIAIPQIATPNASATIESISNIYDTAESLMPEIKSADINEESAAIGIEIAQSNFLPSLSMNYGISSFYSSAQKDILLGYSGTTVIPIGYAINPIDNTQIPVFTETQDRSNPIIGQFGFIDQLDESLRRSVGFTVNIPIYNRHQTKNAVANATIAQKRASLNAQLARNTLRSSVEQAYQDVVAASQTYQSNEKQVKALEETFRTTQERFNLGVTNITDFTVAQNNLNVAKTNLIRAKYDFVFKSKVLDFYMGKSIVLE